MDINLHEILKKVAPGTSLREGLDNILNAKKGALIVVGDTHEVMDIAHDGFYINCEYTPSYIYELAKMDGAIILSSDLKRILYANVQLYPCQDIVSKETGIRHKTGEKVAKQTGMLVIAVSERRQLITLYKSNYKYILKNINEVLNKANQAIKTLERYRKVLDKEIYDLTFLEFNNSITLFDILNVIQKMEIITRINNEIKMYITELGIEGRLINMQSMELMEGMESERVNLIRDYINENCMDYITVLKGIEMFDLKDLLDMDRMANQLGYEKGIDIVNYRVEARGYRILSNVFRMNSNILEKIVSTFGNLTNILAASTEKLETVEGVEKVIAANIVESLQKYREQFSYK